MRGNHTGGCQCGAVRYRVEGALSRPHICHCRMCQKAAGNYFMPLAGVGKGDFTVTSGEIAWFQSSAPVRRGFCAGCGTPLILDTVDAAELHLMLGSLDDPAAVKPERQVGIEARMPWLEELAGLPASATGGEADDDAGFLDEIAATSRQHPDHDTDGWPERGNGG